MMPAAEILCVDDDPHVVAGLALLLRQDYTVHTATSGEEALRRLQERPGIRVIVSDLHMPGMDGAALLARVMRQKPHVARILLSGNADSDAENQYRDLVFRFLRKPCPGDELLVAIEGALR